MRLPGFVKCLRAATSIYSIATSPSFRGFAIMSTDSTLLSCQKNSYAKESHNKVLYCQPLADSTNYRVLLDDSVLYPEGGGQPYDLGSVNGVQVNKVLKPTINIEELVEKGTDTSRCVEVELAGSVEVGSIVKCEVDWNRRYDFMQQHTAQVSILVLYIRYSLKLPFIYHSIYSVQ
jgi:Ser-tRNA(Ala) deacylase AlaX